MDYIDSARMSFIKISILKTYSKYYKKNNKKFKTKWMIVTDDKGE